MNTELIRSRLDASAAVMLAKGLPKPEVEFTVKSNEEPKIYLWWDKLFDVRSNYGSRKNLHSIRGESIEAMLDAADAFIAALPSAEETRHANFMAALGDVIDLGRQNNIKVEYVNPLVETMKRLSENVLTHQKAAAE